MTVVGARRQGFALVTGARDEAAGSHGGWFRDQRQRTTIQRAFGSEPSVTVFWGWPSGSKGEPRFPTERAFLPSGSFPRQRAGGRSRNVGFMEWCGVEGHAQTGPAFAAVSPGNADHTDEHPASWHAGAGIKPGHHSIKPTFTSTPWSTSDTSKNARIRLGPRKPEGRRMYRRRGDGRKG